MADKGLEDVPEGKFFPLPSLFFSNGFIVFFEVLFRFEYPAMAELFFPSKYTLPFRITELTSDCLEKQFTSLCIFTLYLNFFPSQKCYRRNTDIADFCQSQDKSSPTMMRPSTHSMT